MTEVKKENEISAEAKASAEVIVETPENGEELVMAAKIKLKPETEEEVKNETVEPTEDIVDTPEETKEEVKPTPAPSAGSYVSSTVVLTNTTYNTLYLQAEGVSITIAPREIKQVLREDLRTVLNNKVVRNWFDKGVLTSNIDAEDQTVHEAIAPDHLKGPVEKHEGVNISASVKKFVADTPVTINLG